MLSMGKLKGEGENVNIQHKPKKKKKVGKIQMKRREQDHMWKVTKLQL